MVVSYRIENLSRAFSLSPDGQGASLYQGGSISPPNPPSDALIGLRH
jgi:hypothetical protein